jgi:hypothetical protein
MPGLLLALLLDIKPWEDIFTKRGCQKVHCVRGMEHRMKPQPTFNMNVNLLKPTGYVMHQQFNIQQLYALPTLYLCVLYLSENKQRFVPFT